MSAYDKEKVDRWLDHIRADRALVVWVVLCNLSIRHTQDPLVVEFNNMTPPEQLNALYGLKDKANQFMSETIYKASRHWRACEDAEDFDLSQVPPL